jgi:hypothetical protein
MRASHAILAGGFVLALLASVCQADDAKKKKGMLLEQLTKQIEAGKASDKVKKYAKETLLPLCTNAVLVKETAAQNAKKVSLDDIKRIDKEWMEAEDELPIQAEKCGNACAKELKKIVSANSAIVEAFTMDNQGAVVGENALTSDYWQGDEAKWKNSFKGGKGGVDIGKEKFDKSANATLQQVSLPIIDEKGAVIGAVTFGLSLEKL